MTKMSDGQRIGRRDKSEDKGYFDLDELAIFEYRLKQEIAEWREKRRMDKAQIAEELKYRPRG